MAIWPGFFPPYSHLTVFKITVEIIKKNLSVTPNLPAYQEIYNSFHWQDHFKDLLFLENGQFNAGQNITDFNWQEKKDKIAVLWENDKGEKKQFTFQEITSLSNKFAHVLTNLGIVKGDRVFTFLPRVPETFYAFFGILKTGAVGGNFFPAFGKEALLDRLKNSGAKTLITNKELAPRILEIKENLPDLKNILLIDDDLPALLEKESADFNPIPVNLSDPLYMLFTSATGNTPISGIVVPQSALLQEFYTGKWVLDLQKDDIYWCTADPGWVTGTVYGLMVPFMLGITQVVFDGRFSPEAWYNLIQNYKVTVWYTAPTALRMLITKEEIIKNYNLSSLRHLVSVGEALNPYLVDWSQKAFNAPIHDTYWQTETGAMMVTNYPCLDIKPGSMGKPVPGIIAKIVDDSGNEVPTDTEGNLVFEKGFPGMLSGVWQNPSAYKRYFTPPDLEETGYDITKSSYFYTGDRAKIDADGYIWFIGRSNDVIKTSGERVGPFEVESVINKHPKVLESGVIGKPDELRGAIIKAFIVLKQGETPTDELKEEIQKFVKQELAGHAYPREIEFVESLPKNRSGKIVRRILKAKELGQSLGDTSTLEK